MKPGIFVACHTIIMYIIQQKLILTSKNKKRARALEVFATLLPWPENL